MRKKAATDVVPLPREYAQGRQALPRDMRAAPVVWPRAASPRKR